ncbi:hypothetical protein CALCODRAFT_489880 [Calocera cornea HHB12733]|uniref:Uncharacterized protein n=1 Tax=Calocera cornea HHB12733 TaxID=1353952 RepID=A0A165K0I9_9BASI|nr:hypothetical protein CALCODRAFT_489880 [Calocera cornea HHB12733]
MPLCQHSKFSSPTADVPTVVPALKVCPWSVWVEQLEDRKRLKTWVKQYEPVPSLEGFEQAEGWLETASGQEIKVVLYGPTECDIQVNVILDGRPMCCNQYAAGRHECILISAVVDADESLKEDFYGELQVLIEVGSFGELVSGGHGDQKVYAPLPLRTPEKVKAQHDHCIQLGRELPSAGEVSVENTFTFQQGFRFLFYYNTRELLVANSNGAVPSVEAERIAGLERKVTNLEAKLTKLKRSATTSGKVGSRVIAKRLVTTVGQRQASEPYPLRSRRTPSEQ